MNRERAIDVMLSRRPVYVVDGDDHRIHQTTIAEVSVERKADLRYPLERLEDWRRERKKEVSEKEKRQ